MHTHLRPRVSFSYFLFYGRSFADIVSIIYGLLSRCHSRNPSLNVFLRDERAWNGEQGEESTCSTLRVQAQS